jgi:hypothetical protein
MGKKLTGGDFAKAEKWDGGKKIVGFFTGADTPPNCESRKLTFELTTGDKVACWETATLARQVAQMKPGQYYKIECQGKVIDTPNGKAWGFDVEEAADEKEVKTWESDYRKHVAGGGK